MRIPKIFEWSRIIGITAGLFFAYQLGNGDPKTTLHFLSFFVIVVIAGLTGIEGMFFGKVASATIGRKADPGYQKQSGGANLSFAFTAILVFACNWGLYADATILIATLFFFTLSATIHTWEIFALNNRNRKNTFRPVLTLLLIAASVWPLVGSLVE